MSSCLFFLEGPRCAKAKQLLNKGQMTFPLAFDGFCIGEVGRRLWPTARRHGVNRAINQHVFQLQLKSCSKLKNINSCRILWGIWNILYTFNILQRKGIEVRTRTPSISNVDVEAHCLPQIPHIAEGTLKATNKSREMREGKERFPQFASGQKSI